MDYLDMLAKRAAEMPIPNSLQGGSGYFAPRSNELDPALFNNQVSPPTLWVDVRSLVLGTLYHFWANRFAGADQWSTVWLAGSGITTAWNADRESDGAPGDLDCLIGVHYEEFYRRNRQYQGNSEDTMAAEFNQGLHDYLWPRTAATHIAGSVYELTYYVNPGATDIRNINPYAAYNVTDNMWTVRPVKVPKGFSEDYFSPTERAVVARDKETAEHFLDMFRGFKQHTDGYPQDNAHTLNYAALLHNIVREGAAKFDEIHDGRHAAFAPGGKGYFDFANYRWQGGKASGAVGLLRQFKQLDEQAHRDIGTPCSNVNHLLYLAALANG